MSAVDPKQTLRKHKLKESKSQQPPNGAERLKTVVRRLPPNLPEEIFWQSVQAWVTDETVTWRAFSPGKTRKRVNKENVSSRAYIAFKNEEQVAAFSREYDGHLFRDKAGNESRTVVEFAPFQKTPAEKKKVDARNNTIDKDEDYISFLETLKSAEKAEPLPLEALIAAFQPPPPPTTTPLLEALKAEKSAQKDKEAILRNHAHYKDSAATGTTLKKEEAKKKAAAAGISRAAKQPEPPAPPTSKKAKKAAAAAAAVAQKAQPPRAQDGQTAPPKGQHAGAAGSLTTKALAATPPAAPRARPPKEPHGRQHSAKGATAAPVPAQPKPNTIPASPTSTEGAAVAAPAQGQARRGRPVIGLGRQFEAALNGAGVAVGSGGDRKKRDKGGESGSGAAEGSGGAGKGKESRDRHEEEKTAQAPVVPSILQRPETAGGPPEVVIMQRPQSPLGTESTGGNVDSSAGRGGARRGRARGRGGNRGG
ncbi:hypothetical protein BS17DRAFT_795258 [Gyrodon lividus]|nr:hypothetical protein BS17DRAFT_795258 [Gyrodon lividus]